MALAFPALAFGQANADSQQNKVQNLSAVTVTGSHIPRTDLVTSQPVLNISHQEIENSGIKTVGQFLDNMTSVGFVEGSVSGAWSGDGSERVDLRYLGANRLLVLLNGKRVPSSFGGTVDMNQIPISIVDRIEILKDGASAVYGADAIAGVINIITKKDLNGFNVSAYYGVAQGPKNNVWDSHTTHVDLSFGRSGDWGHVLVDTSFMKAGGISGTGRDFAIYPSSFNNTRGDLASPEGDFMFWAPTEGDPTKPGTVPAPYTGLTAAQCPDQQTPEGYYIPFCHLAKTPMTSGKNAADYHVWSNTDRWMKGTQTNLITIPQNIKNVFVEGSYNIAPSVTLSVSALYNDRQSTRPQSPDVDWFDNVGTDIGIGKNGNPFGFRLAKGIPVQVATTPGGDPVILQDGTLQGIYRNTPEQGIRIHYMEARTMLFSGGLKGHFSSGSTIWHWDLDYVYGSYKLSNKESGASDTNALTMAINPNCSSIPGCVPLDLFRGQGADGKSGWTQAMVDYISPAIVLNELDRKNTRVLDAGLSTSNLIDLPAGGLGFALGVQRRDISGATEVPGLNIPNLWNSTPSQGLSGEYSVNSAYVEFNVPVLSSLPGAQYLAVDVAARHEDYSTFGTTNTGRLGILYQPIEDVVIRGSYSEGFRAADLEELYSPLSRGYPYVADPCSNYTAPGTPGSIASNCAAAGVPASYVQGTPQINGIYAGNPDLKPETSKSKTLGLVYSPSQLPGLNISLDYYHIDLSQEISSFGGKQILDFCYESGLPQFCSLVERESNGTIKQVRITSTNVGKTKTAGVDLDMAYHFPQTSFGQFGLKVNATHVNYFTEYNPRPDGSVAVTQMVGNLDYRIVPQLKSYASVDFKRGPFYAAFIGHYFSGFTGSCSDGMDGTQYSLTNLGFCTHPNKENNALSTTHRDALSWFDLHLSYRASSDLSFSFGVNNIFGQTPKGNREGYRFVPALDYGVFSRFFYTQVEAKF